MRYAVRTRPWLAFIGVLLLTLSLHGFGKADDAEEIDDKVDDALVRFKEHIKGADDYLRSAKGILVLPEVKKGGLVVAGQWGQGALRVQNRSVAFYKIEAGSFGVQLGYQQVDLVFVFFTDAALQKFRANDTWSAGAESGITLVEKGFGGSVDTLKAKGPIAGFAFGKKGLMGGWSLKGTKFTRFVPEP